jgi:hypothetical protein
MHGRERRISGDRQRAARADAEFCGFALRCAGDRGGLGCEWRGGRERCAGNCDKYWRGYDDLHGAYGYSFTECGHD